MRLHLVDVTDFSLRDGTKSADWFETAFAALDPAGEIDLVVHDGVAEELPDPADVARRRECVIVTGSRGPVDRSKPWVPPLLDLLAALHEAGADLLGVCFGCQALAIVLGGEVTANPRGREMGTVRITLTEAGRDDPLFAGLPAHLTANLVHKMHVSTVPPGAVRLATNRMTPVQGFRLGRSVGLQPHPEMTPRILNGLVDLYGRILVREGFVDDKRHLTLFRETFEETPLFRRALLNFVSPSAG